MGTIFAPATALMSRLKYPQRFLLITLLFVVSLGFALYMFFAEVQRQVNFSAKEREGVVYLQPVAQLYAHAIEERMLNLPARLGLSMDTTAAKANQQQIELDLAALEVVEREHGGSLNTAEKMNAVRAAWKDAKSAPPDGLRDEKLVTFTSSIEELIAHVGNSSNIILDPDLDTYYIQDLLLNQLPKGQGVISEITLQAYDTITRRGADPKERATLAVQLGLLSGAVSSAKRDVEIAIASNAAGNLAPALQNPMQVYEETVDFFLSRVNEEVVTAPNIIVSQDFLVTTARDALYGSRNLWEAGLAPFDGLLQARLESLEGRRMLSLGVALGVMFLLIYLWGGFYQSVRRTAISLEKASHILENGVVSEADTLQLDGKDELSIAAAATFSKIAAAANQMNSAIGERTSELTEVAAVLAHHPDGILIADEQGIVKVLNGAASKLLHTNFDTAVGRSLPQLTADPSVGELIRVALQMPGQHHYVDTMVNGRILSVGATYVPIADGKHSGLITLQDATELRMLQHVQQAAMVPVAR